MKVSSEAVAAVAEAGCSTTHSPAGHVEGEQRGGVDGPPPGSSPVALKRAVEECDLGGVLQVRRQQRVQRTRRHQSCHVLQPCMLLQPCVGAYVHVWVCGCFLLLPVPLAATA